MRVNIGVTVRSLCVSGNNGERPIYMGENRESILYCKITKFTLSPVKIGR